VCDRSGFAKLHTLPGKARAGRQQTRATASSKKASIRWETAEQDLSGGGLTPDEIMDKLEERVGPEGRKLFERFLRDVNELGAPRHLEAQAQTCVTERSGKRGPV
jgi:hypothetical protein